MRRENLDQELAEEIANRLDAEPGRSRCCRVGRLAPQLGVEKAIKLLGIGG
jgi:hypothetical protein